MPVLHKNTDGPGHHVRSEFEGRSKRYRVAPEGERFLIHVLGLNDGDEFDDIDLDFLIGRGWASEWGPEADPVEPAEAPEVPVEREPPAPAAPERPAPAPEPEPVRPPRTQPTGSSRRADGPRPPLTRRTRAREIALQVLYQLEQNPGYQPADVDRFIDRRLREGRLRDFAHELIAGVRANQPRIDALISEVAENWRLDRMAAIDRNILRLGAFEMLFVPDVPTKVAINEALELAKRYSTAQSSRFVNGILDRLQEADPNPGAGPESGSASVPAETAGSPAESPPPPPPVDEPPPAPIDEA